MANKEVSSGSVGSEEGVVKQGDEDAKNATKMHKEALREVLNVRVLFVCFVAGCGGLLFGYENGSTGGVSNMDAFLGKFFPEVLANKQAGASGDLYCQFNSDLLALVTSVVFLSGIVGAFLATAVTNLIGRRNTIVLAACFYALGATLAATAVNLAMLVCGRLVIGIGLGLANQSCPLYLSEMAPPTLRGSLNIIFQLVTTAGIWIAQGVNLGVSDMDNGWHIAIGVGAILAGLLGFFAIMLPDSPRNMLERGKDVEKARKILQKMRINSNIDEELQEIQVGLEKAKRLPKGYRAARILFSRKYAPHAVIGCLIPFFQQFTGVNVVIFFSPQLLRSVAQSSDEMLSTMLIGAVNFGATLVSLIVVDRLGRKILLTEGASQMLVTNVVLAIMLAVGVTSTNAGGIGAVVLTCVYIAGFAWSYGPIGWLLPSEIQPPETRSIGMSVSTMINFLCSFIIAQSFLPMLCAFKWGIYLFFAFFLLAMLVFTLLFVPETKNLSLEQIQVAIYNHWFWRRMREESDEELARRINELSDNDPEVVNTDTDAAAGPEVK